MHGPDERENPIQPLSINDLRKWHEIGYIYAQMPESGGE
jgi:hypothetical protein